MKVPNISSLFRWVNNFQPGVQNTSRDFVQLIRQSDGEVLGWIDESGYLQGSLAASVPEEDADAASVWLEDDFVSQTVNISSGLVTQYQPLGSLNWIVNAPNAVPVLLFTAAPPNVGAVSIFTQGAENVGVTLSLGPGSAATALPQGFPLTLNTGWEANFVFQWPPLSSTSQVRMYLGFGFDGTPGITSLFAYGRPSKFIGLRYDTDPGNQQFAIHSVNNASLGVTEYKVTLPAGTIQNQFNGSTFVVTGFANPNNNGTFESVASIPEGSLSTLTLNNPNGVAVSAAGTATMQNPAISDTAYHFECVQNPSQNSNVQGTTYNTGIVPDNNWHRFRMRSIVQGQILFSIDGGTETMLQMSTDTASGVDVSVLNEGSYGLFEPDIAGSVCSGTNLTVSGSAYAGNNGTFPVAIGAAGTNPNILILGSFTPELGGNPNLTFKWYNTFAPVIIVGNDSSGTPSATLNVDYFSFTYSPRLALDFNGVANPTLPRFFNGQT